MIADTPLTAEAAPTPSSLVRLTWNAALPKGCNKLVLMCLSKYRKLVPALALVFALVDTPDSDHVIHGAELLRALAWADYLRTHAERLYSVAVMPETVGAHALLAKIRAGKLADGFRLKDLQQKGWTGLATTEAARKAAEMLVDFDWLMREAALSGRAGGRPGESFRIHPKVLPKKA